MPNAFAIKTTTIDDFPTTSQASVSGPLHKYMKAEHAKALVEKGTVRIGSLFEYRSTETYNKAIGDNGEGKLKSSTARQPSDPVAQQLSSMAGVTFKNVRMIGFDKTISVDFESHDYYIYCASRVYDKKAMQEFGYDVCVRINEPNRFFEAITEKLAIDFDLRGVFDLKAVHYGNRDVGEDVSNVKKLPPWIVKELVYSYQQEARARWAPKTWNSSALCQIPPVSIEGLKNYATLIIE